MPFKFKLDHNVVEAIKNICCVKDEGAVDHSTAIRLFKKIYPSYNKLDNQTRLVRPKTMDFKTLLRAIEAILVRKTLKVSGEFSISQFNVVCQFHNLIQSIQNVPYVTKILQNFCLTLV